MEITSNSKIPFELRQAVENNELIVFAGAGTSEKLKLPNWKKLVIQLIENIRNDDYRPFINLIENNILTPLDVLNFLERSDKVAVTDGLDYIIGNADYLDLKTHLKLISLSSKIITTNYDRGFEDAWLQEYNKQPNIVKSDSPYKLSKLATNENFIFKMHGSIDNAASCILFEKQYQKLYHIDSAFLLELKFLFLKNTLLFVGFSLTDPYINEILAAIANLYQGFSRNHFIITTDSTLKVPSNIKIIGLRDYNELFGYLDQLISLKPIKTNLPSRPYIKFFGRNKEIKEILNLLNGNYSLVIIEGLSGVGKSGLVLETAYTCLQKKLDEYNGNISIFEYIIWVSAQEVKQDLNSILDIIGRVYNSEKITKISQHELTYKIENVQLLLRNHKSLIIIDNFESITNEGIIEWVKNIPSPSKMLITTSKNVFDDHMPYQLLGLDEPDAKALIEYELATDNNVNLFNHEGLQEMVKKLRGNIRILQLAAGQIRSGNFAFAIDGIQNLQTYFHDLAWENISPEARNLVFYFTVFDGILTIRKSTLKDIAGLAEDQFSILIFELTQSALLTYIEADDQFSMPQSSRNIISMKGINTNELKLKWAEFYINFVKQKILRNNPDEVYWNALVSEKMVVLKDEWKSISEVINWLDNNITDNNESSIYENLFLDFMIMLIHYMDSRFYNQERLRYVQKAIICCDRLKRKYEQALLKIDALGWTFSEESAFESAKLEIEQGMAIAENLDNQYQVDNLTALGKAWMARILAEAGQLNQAHGLISEALIYETKDWIAYRVHMAAGDVYVYSNEYQQALEEYEIAKVHFNKYGGEGNSYQINPRIGLAYVRTYELDKDDDYLIKAENVFKSVFEGDLALGNLYGEFGLALINYHRGNKVNAISKIEDIQTQLLNKSSSNVLLKLIKDYLNEIKNN